jgi:phosphoribosylaminoimidazolecarboxamide formyltransferase/IMP cyclohydrolase
MKTLAEHRLPEIDLVVCNLYPFEQTVAKPGVTEAEAIENIDIGGPCMVRAAAKNFDAVAVAVEPTLYPTILRHLAEHNGSLPRDVRKWLAKEAFFRIESYDFEIFDYFSHTAPDLEPKRPAGFGIYMRLKQELRYGENPHQGAKFYVEPNNTRPCVATAEQLHGKELSYNNILDLDSALNLVREFAEPAAVVVKHNNPCGAAVAGSVSDAFRLAWDGDPQSAFGGILAFNKSVDAATAEALAEPGRFVECIIAPDFDPAAFDTLTTKPTWKKNVRLLRTGPLDGLPQGLDYRRVDGGLLVQTRDVGADDFSKWETKTKRAPTADELAALKFAWLVCKHVKSNAIVLVSPTRERGLAVVGVGAGQMSRVDSVQIAVRKAGERVKGSVLASDAFFPFRDNVDAAAAAGVTAIAQPGGSQRDADSTAAADEHGLTMVFTGVRHFRH